MIVKELIEKLKTFPEDKAVWLIYDDENPMEGGWDITDIFMIDGAKNEANNAVYIVKG